MNKLGGKYVAQVKDRESGVVTLIQSSKYCKTKKLFKESLEEYYIIEQIVEV
ncbi:hypothetical protein [Lysinibacillus sphaericus]|uniref:hypothetical protein n=1 Tax=Lysinibacillus sphaericus TaxID=1421 RepID=UPI0018CF4454|nr:hypothetical protein [Lysinibacillus sphaericus]